MENHQKKVSAIFRILRNINKGLCFPFLHDPKCELFHLDIKAKGDPRVLGDSGTIGLYLQGLYI